MMPTADLDMKTYLLDVFKTPARIAASGLALLALAYIWQKLIDGPAGSWTVDKTGVQLAAGALVLIGGVGVVALLWWLASAFYRLVQSGRIDGASVDNIKDTPMGLPEGTVRAILALLVAMVGLPLLLFQGVFGVHTEIAGYINGIVAGVFGFYFGTRTSGIPAKAVDKMVEAQQTAIAKKSEADAAVADADSMRSELADTRANAADELQRARQAGGFDRTLETASRHFALADFLVKTYGQQLPAGLIPAGTADVLAEAEKTLAGVGAATGQGATPEQLDASSRLCDALTGSASPVGALLKGAAPLVAGAAPVPGLGPVASLATILGLGFKLGSGAYQRWRARMLAAPVGQGLVAFGAVTPEVLHAALRQAPLLANALASRPPTEAESNLSNAIVSPDGAELLLAAYGPKGNMAHDLLSDAEQAKAGLAQLEQAVLALYSTHDIDQDMLQQVAAGLSAPALPELAAAPAQQALRDLTPADAGRLVDAVAGISTRQDLPKDQRAAFDALVMLVDAARSKNIDLVAALAELRQ
jgi:hypothetical protein